MKTPTYTPTYTPKNTDFAEAAIAEFAKSGKQPLKLQCAVTGKMFYWGMEKATREKRIAKAGSFEKLVRGFISREGKRILHLEATKSDPKATIKVVKAAEDCAKSEAPNDLVEEQVKKADLHETAKTAKKPAAKRGPDGRFLPKNK